MIYFVEKTLDTICTCIMACTGFMIGLGGFSIKQILPMVGAWLVLFLINIYIKYKWTS